MVAEVIRLRTGPGHRSRRHTFSGMPTSHGKLSWLSLLAWMHDTGGEEVPSEEAQLEDPAAELEQLELLELQLGVQPQQQPDSRREYQLRLHVIWRAVWLLKHVRYK